MGPAEHGTGSVSGGWSLDEPAGVSASRLDSLPHRLEALDDDLPAPTDEAEPMRGRRVRLFEEVPFVLAIVHVRPHVAWSLSAYPQRGWANESLVGRT
jgi:hypothetical protein